MRCKKPRNEQSGAGRRVVDARHGHGASWRPARPARRWGGRDAAWRRPEPLGIIAGTLPIGLGWMTGRLPGRSDGLVRVEETLVEGMAQQVSVPVAHSALIVSPRVAGLVGHFLAA